MGGGGGLVIIGPKEYVEPTPGFAQNVERVGFFTL